MEQIQQTQPLSESGLIVGEEDNQQEEIENINTNEKRPVVNWKIISTSNPPSPRFDCTVVNYKDQLYLYGGSDGTSTPQGFSSFLKLDLKDYSWQSTHCEHRTRVLHTAVVYQDCMYIYGGGWYEDERAGFFYQTQKVFKSLNELICYNFERKEWSKVESDAGTYQPEARDGHCSVVVDNQMYIIGGSQTLTNLSNKKTPVSSIFFQSIDIFDFSTRTWKQAPSPRFGRLCSAVAYKHLDGSQYIYVLGGYDSASKGTSDLWQMDMTLGTWKLIKPKSTVNIPDRYGHTSNVFQDKMYVYGGYSKKGFLRDFYSFDFAKEEWTQIETNGPPKRRRHCTVLLEDQGKTKLVLYGGTYLSCLYNDLWEYQFPSDVYIPSDNLVADFGRLFQQPLDFFSDVCFLLEEDKKIHAHKAILSVRSPYFKGLFGSGLKESFEKEIKIQEKYSDFVVLIEFLYTGNENLVQLENCIGLLYLSDLYCIPRLKTICESRATEGIDCESVVDIFQQADFYKLDKLRKISLNYIARHNKELNDNGTMKQLSPSVLLEIISYLESQNNLNK
ncbi:hypothetical protein DLAC_00963 [Tieghemostelium lacteum]|uniref:BTB domain-containing protein n=1 Tax=Tieghemostelium lacteum TaxID=361077 RepID=A0A152A7F0_TIELA|nr:hypothetical protein DLAC_00963 [Tieghemostelium lacteum]|eukprot:KYR02159.1 hypothetical protein DLAC_00963 [Tieghemostelium lacteum]